MRNKTFIVTLVVVISALCLFYLSFSVVSWKVNSDAKNYASGEIKTVQIAKKNQYLDSLWNKEVFNFFGADFTLKEVRKNEIKLGLDLQGGMHLVLEIAPESIISNLALSPDDPALNKAIAEAKSANESGQFVDNLIAAYEAQNPEKRLVELFLTPSNNEELSIASSNKEVADFLKSKIDGAVDRSFKILRDRIDRFGVANPNIQKLPGSDRIQIELPGVEDPQRIRKLVQGMAQLQFYEVYSMSELSPMITAANTAWLSKQKLSQDTTNLLTALSTDSLDLQDKSLAEEQSPFISKLAGGGTLMYNLNDTASINAFLSDQDVNRFFPSTLEFKWGAKSETGDEGVEYLELYPLKLSRGNKALLEGDVINAARQDLDEMGQPAVSMQMNPQGARVWKKITAQHINERIAIVLDDHVYSAPYVRSEIPNGSSSISGSFTLEEAKDLANVLEAGKLPASTTIVEEAVVGPSLGQETIAQGLISMIAGLGLVIVFMMFYYNNSGAIANLALFLNVFFILGILVQFGAALTLPGIAGIVLTIGMSVDANVLIFERIKEELNLGQSIKAAVNTGYTKAYSSIVDSNVTTFLTGAILYMFGSGSVKGFAVVLMIGIACSLFTAVFVTRLIIEWQMKRNASKVKFDTFLSKKLFSLSDFDFIKKRKLAYVFSIALICLGGLALILKGGIPLGIDFKGGRSYIVKFEEPFTTQDVRKAMEVVFPNASLEVKTFNGEEQLKITTSYRINDNSEAADAQVEKALKQGLVLAGAEKAEIVSTSKIGPTMADDLKADAQTAVFYSLIVIFLYILIRFRKWQYSLGAIIALLHDVLMVLSFFAIANLFGLHLEIDQVFIAAILTVIGYSINDTVVVFDRIREFASRGVGQARTFNIAINNTLSRTTITSFTVFIVVITLLLFGGDVLRGFSLALLIGVIFGTYSSIFIAAPVVIDLDKAREDKKLPRSMESNLNVKKTAA